MYPNYFDFHEVTGIPEMGMGSMIGTLFGIYFGAILFLNLYSVAVYILHALGLYTIANRRGIHNPWLAWIPFGSIWILGSIADQYQYVAKGHIRNRRKSLLGMEIVLSVLAIAMLVVSVLLAVRAITMEMSGAYNEDALLIFAGVIAIITLAVMVLAIVLTVVQYICYYNLFVSCIPKHGALLLVLSIFFTFLLPFFVFGVRKKDLGMPPRKPQIPAYQEPVAEPEPESVENLNYPE